MKVQTTTNYKKFKAIDGNRNLNLLHLKRLKKSMSEKYLFTSILVNANFEIIDGQHRFEVIKELGLPLNYIMVNEYGLDEVHILNQNSKVWNANDYMEGYINMGNKEYEIYKDFKEKYGFCHNECMALLKGQSRGSGDLYSSFRNGDYKVTHLQEAESNADKITLFKEFYSGYKRRSFVSAILELLQKDNFDIKQLLSKLKFKSLYDCTTSKDYIIQIEDIYNFKSHNKVSLRY